MTDLSSLTDEQLLAIAGQGNSASLGNVSVSDLSDDQLLSIVNSHKKPSLLGRIANDVMETPGAIYDAVTSIPSGISNTFSSIFSPVDSINDGTTEKTLRGWGSLGAATAGAGTGATFGAPFGPAGVIIGGALGGASGLLGFDFLNQATGSDAPTTGAEDVEKLRKNTVQGITTGAILKGAEAGAGKFAKWAPEEAGKLDRKSIGARQSDYQKSIEDIGTIEIDPSDVGSRTKLVIDELLGRGELGTSRKPSTLTATLNEKTSNLSGKVHELISQFDESGGDVGQVRFPNAVEAIDRGIIPAELADKYLKKIIAKEDALALPGNTSLDFLQKQKVAQGDLWDANNAVENAFNRAVYKDLQQHIESKVPDVAPLNAELAKFKLAEPILKRNLAASEATDLGSLLIAAGRTSGGIGVPLLSAAYTGNPLLAVGGLAARQLFLTPGGRAFSARALRGAAPYADMTSQALSRALAADGVMPTAQALGEAGGEPTDLGVIGLSTRDQKSNAQPNTAKESQLSAPLPESGGHLSQSSLLEPTSFSPLSNQEFMDNANPIKDLLYKAVIQQESAGNPNALSDKGAIGLMQVMPATAADIAKELGLESYDLRDPETNKIFGQYYLDKMLRLFNNDPELALTAYHSGPGRVQKLLEQTGGNSLADILPYLGPVGQKYASGVLSKLAKLSKQVEA